MKKADVFIGIFLILLSILVIVDSSTLPATTGDHDVGASFFPITVSSILILLSVITIWNGMREKKELISFSRKSFTCILFTIFYIVLVYLTGFYISTVLFMLVFMWCYRYRKKWMMMLVTIIVTGGIYLVFEKTLQVPLPSGLFFN